MSVNLKQVSDEELAVKAQAGSRSCFEELVSRYSHKLFFYLRSKISSDQDTEDIVQETFLKIYRNIWRYDPKWKFSTWLYTAAQRLGISHFRSKAKKDFRDMPLVSYPDQEEKYLKQEQYRNIWETARSLNPSQYKALWLRYVEDLTIKEISEIMKNSPVTVRVLLHRARSKLAARFKLSSHPCINREKINPERQNLVI